MKIEILPANVANMIAAGEVVQGPSSVVKEMMENSVDAGATSVSVIISDAGRTLIRIIDNGSGMSREDALTCFERHATSKISRPEDLESILTYGFRGEALASIAAVSEVTLKTRRREDETGTCIEYADSKLLSVSETASAAGADFSVRNLFYNVPARRKFLKSDASEFRKILSEFNRIALTHPELSLRLVHNDRDVHNLPPAQSLKMRIADLMGKEPAKELVSISTETSVLCMSGFIGKPENAKKVQPNQFFFVNGRFFRSAYLHKAVMRAYEGLVAQGTSPSYFLYVKCDPGTVDVNIHPSKTEVKFEEEQVVFQIVYAGVKEALGKNSFVNSIDFDVEGVPEIPVFNPRDNTQVRMPQIKTDPDYNPFKNYDSSPRPDFGRLFDDSQAVSSEDVMVVGGKYIISKVRDGIQVTNIVRARERILYSRMIQSVAMGEIFSQAMVYPVEVETGKHAVSLIEEYSGLLLEAGFDIRPFGETSVAVYGQPSGYGSDKETISDTVSELVASLDESAGELRSSIISNIAVRLSHTAALADKSVPNRSEARALIGQLEGCEDAATSPCSGKRCYSVIQVADMEKLLVK